MPPPMPLLALLLVAALARAALAQLAPPAEAPRPASPTPRPSSSGLVEFSLDAPEARRVFLAGDFNAWAANVNGVPSDPAALMSKRDDGRWSIAIRPAAELLRYKFVIEHADGRLEWRADPAIPDRDRDGNTVILSTGASDGPSALAAETPALTLRVTPASGRLAVILKNPDGTIRDAVPLPRFLVDRRPQTGLRATAAAVGTEFAGADAILSAQVVSPRAVAITLTPRDGAAHDLAAVLDDNSRFYGGGERFNALNHKGTILTMASLDRPEDKGTCTYKPVPFIISSRGYGLWLDSTAPATFDLNATSRSLVTIADRNTRFRLVIIAGPTPADILAEFTRLTGRPAVPPAWAFAPWKSRDIHKGRDELLADAELSRRHDLPASVIVIDSPWSVGYNDFFLNERQFDRPAEVFARFRALGFVPCFWLTPFVNQSSVTDMRGISAGPASNFAEAAARGFLVKGPDGEPRIVDWWKGRGALVDFTNPAATAWWHTHLERMLPWGVAALKCDAGESNFVADDATFHDASSPADMKGRYTRLYLEAAAAFLEAHRPGDHTLISRAGTTGTGRLPFGWAGDNEASFSFDNGLPGVIIAAQNAALSGQPFWGSDIAGYIGDPTPELFVRWTQFAAFSPLMMVHMTSNKGPWDFGPEALDIYRTYARLHTRLYPYIDAAAHEAASNGTPIIRPMLLAFPDDPDAAEHRFQYMFGPDLLVAPMYQPGSHRALYLPRGTWTDYWTGARHAGPLVIEAEAPLDRIPLYIRAGAIISMLPPDIDTLLPRTPETDPSVVTLDDRRVVEVWPGERGAAKTSDGMEVALLKTASGEHILTVTTDRPRPIELRLRHVTADIRATRPDPTAPASRPDRDDTVLRVDVPEGESRFTWR